MKLCIDSITKTFNHKPILSDIYLACNEGEVVGLFGRNGSGKSTLLKIIFGILNADNKHIRVNSKIIKNLNDGRKLINYLPQEHFLPNGVLIKSIIKLFLKKNNRTIVLENKFIKPLLNKKNEQLSGGEKRIIELLLILHSEAKFILLDEPFNGLSPIIRDYIITYINTIKWSKGIIITDHDYENVLKISDSILFLKSGFLKTINNKNELQELGYLINNDL